MKLIYILRLIRGFVTFEVSDGFTERFINLCAANRIAIWDVSIRDERLKASILVRNFRRLRPVLRKAGCKITITSKAGLPFFFHKNKKRSGLLICVIFFSLFATVMNQFIWTVEVTGTSTVGHEEIIRVTRELGLKKGSLASAIDTTAISRLAVNHFSGKLLWMAINIKGSKAMIEVRDYVDEHIDESFTEPCNLVADFDGTLLTVEIFNGDREVFPGNAVKKGDLLISGVVENRDLSCTYCEARGRITALHNVTYKKSYNEKKQEHFSLQNEKTRHYLDIFSLKLPTDFSIISDTDRSFIKETYLTWDNTSLPLGIIKESSYTEVEAKADKYTFFLIAVDNYTSSYYKQFGNTNIIESKTSISYTDGYPVFVTEMKCIDFMGTKSPISANFYEN